MRCTTRLALALLSAGAAAGCSPAAPAAPPAPAPASWTPALDVSTRVTAEFTLTVDTRHAALATARREPQEGPAVVRGGGEAWRAVARAKALPVRPELRWVDVYFTSTSTLGVVDLELDVTATASVVDLTLDPLATAPLSAALRVGGVGPEGVAHVALGVPVAPRPVELSLRLRGRTTTRRVASSGPIQVTPQGDEVWLAVPDGDRVVVLDAAADRRLAEVVVPGRPTSVALGGAGDRVLVASADANTVTVIARESRQIVQVLTEADGLGRDLRHVVASSDGARAYASAYVGDSVAVLERGGDDRYRVVGVVPVGRRPTGLSLTAHGDTLLVAHHLPRGPIDDNEAWLSVIDTAALTVHHEAVLRDDSNLLESRCLAERFGARPEEVVFEGSFTQLSGVFLDPGGVRAWAPSLRFAPLPVWEVPPGLALPGVVRARFTPPFIAFFDARRPEAVAPELHPGVLDPPDVDLAYLRCARLAYANESPSKQDLPGEPDAQTTTGVATPAGATGLEETGLGRFIGFTRGGRRALHLSHVADELAVFDAATQHPVSRRHLLLSGNNPLGLAVSPDGRRAWVVYENSPFVSVLDLSAYADPTALPEPSWVPFELRRIPGLLANSTLTQTTLVRFVAGVPELPAIRELAQITVLDRDPLSPAARRGKILFSSSSPTKYPQLSLSPQTACASCHPDGGHDGSGWATMEGERRTVTLRGGVAGRGWLHQSATHVNAEEFVDTVVSERLGGTLDDEDTRALALHLARGIPHLQRPRVDPALAARGAATFAQRCAGCHAGPAATSGAPSEGDPWGGGEGREPGLYDLGTASSDMRLILPRLFTNLFPSPTKELFVALRGDRALGPDDVVQRTLGFRARPPRARGQLKAVSLAGAWDHVLYYHDARHTSLEAAVADMGQRLGAPLTEAEVAELSAYLKTL